MSIALAIAAAFVVVCGLFIGFAYFLTTTTERQRALFRDRGILTTANIMNTRLTEDMIFVDYEFIDVRTKQRFKGYGQVASLPPRTANQTQRIEVIYVADDPKKSGIVSNWFEPHEAASLRQAKSRGAT